MLMLHPGAFVPNIQRFVGGMESATKRLAVSICEDSYIEDTKCLFSMYVATAISQQDKIWQPTNDLIKYWMEAAILAQKDKRLFDYNIKSKINEKYKTVNNNDFLLFNYILLSEIKSFESDINMVYSIAKKNGKPRTYTAKYNLLKIMPFIHCIDHHIYTDIAYYMNPPVDKIIGQYTFKSIFINIWNTSSGVNPRNVKYENWDKHNEKLKEIRNAQRLVWYSKITTPKNIEYKTISQYQFKYKLDESWLAGLIGPIEIKIGHVTAIVVLRCDNIYTFTAIKRPSRDTKSATELTEHEKNFAISKVKNILKNGYQLKNVPATLSELLHNVYVYYDNEIEEYNLHFPNKIIIKWEEFIYMNYNFPIFENIQCSIDNALQYTCNGIMENADTMFLQLLKNTSKDILYRLVTYLEGNKSEILLFKIARDGSGVDYAVLSEDVGVHTMLCHICCLYPVALVKNNVGFKVKFGPLLWSIRDRLVTYLKTEVKIKNVWHTLPITDKRVLWEHQEDILKSMISKHMQGKKGHEIWATVGSGKSLIVLSYINYLIQHNKMPEYCVYTLPPSAINAIIKEIEYLKIPYLLIDMRIGQQNQKIMPGMINIVRHDHMRLNGFDLQMKKLASKLFFIIDEFHKTISKTIRTSIALEIAKLSVDFVAMTGTLIKDNNIDELIQWLSQVVVFEVTTHNYFTALSALISKKVQTNIIVDRLVIEAELTDPKYYYSLVPKTLGGTSDTLNFKEALYVCYESITLKMINQAMEYINQGEKIFMVAKDVNHQLQLQTLLNQRGITQIFLINAYNSIVLTPADNSPIQVVITTMKNAEGYTLTDRSITISCVCLSNQAQRDQLDGRTNRIGQYSPKITLIVIHAGILSYILKRYESARSLAEAIKGFASDINLEDWKQITKVLQ